MENHEKRHVTDNKKRSKKGAVRPKNLGPKSVVTNKINAGQTINMPQYEADRRSDAGSKFTGKFCWEEIEGVAVPFIIRSSGEMLGEITMLKKTLYKKQLEVLHDSVFAIACPSANKQKATKLEKKLLNEINAVHCDYYFSKSPCFPYTFLLSKEEAVQLYNVLDVFYKVVTERRIEWPQCGYILINESNTPVPFVDVEGVGMVVPLFFFECPEVMRIKLMLKDHWAVAYLKLFCKLLSVLQTFYNGQTIAVVKLENLTDIILETSQFTIVTELPPSIKVSSLMKLECHEETIVVSESESEEQNENAESIESVKTSSPILKSQDTISKLYRKIAPKETVTNRSNTKISVISETEESEQLNELLEETITIEIEADEVTSMKKSNSNKSDILTTWQNLKERMAEEKSKLTRKRNRYKELSFIAPKRKYVASDNLAKSEPSPSTTLQSSILQNNNTCVSSVSYISNTPSQIMTSPGGYVLQAPPVLGNAILQPSSYIQDSQTGLLIPCSSMGFILPTGLMMQPATGLIPLQGMTIEQSAKGQEQPPVNVQISNSVIILKQQEQALGIQPTTSTIISESTENLVQEQSSSSPSTRAFLSEPSESSMTIQSAALSQIPTSLAKTINLVNKTKKYSKKSCRQSQEDENMSLVFVKKKKKCFKISRKHSHVVLYKVNEIPEHLNLKQSLSYRVVLRKFDDIAHQFVCISNSPSEEGILLINISDVQKHLFPNVNEKKFLATASEMKLEIFSLNSSQKAVLVKYYERTKERSDREQIYFMMNEFCKVYNLMKQFFKMCL